MDSEHADGANPFTIQRVGEKGFGKWTLHIDGLEKTGETDAYTYWIQEVTVPGYVAVPRIVVVTKDSVSGQETETEINSVNHASPESEIRITNSKYNVSLPSTGGPGTTALYLLGSMLIMLAGAGFILMGRKKRVE